MGYSMSVHLKQDAPSDVLEDILRNSKFLANNESVYVSQIAKEHGYSVHYDKGLYISFSTINNTESYFIHSFFKQMAEWYGEKTINPQDQKSYAFYNYDSEITLLIPEDEFLQNRDNYKEFSAENGVIVSDDYVEELYEKAEANNNDADDATENIKYFSFDYISSKPYKIDFSASIFIVNFVTNEDKIFKEIFKTIQSLETEIIKKTYGVR